MSESDDPSKVVSLMRPAACGRKSEDVSLQPLASAIKVELASLTDEPFSTEDQRVIDEEAEFIGRFGFDWPRRFRCDLIVLKHDLDLTDAEIRLLQKTGNFSLASSGLRLTSNRWLSVCGWAQIVCLAIFIGTPLAYVFLQTPLSLFRFGVWLIFLVAWLSLSRAIFLFYVRPWQIQYRAQTKRSVPG